VLAFLAFDDLMRWMLVSKSMRTLIWQQETHRIRVAFMEPAAIQMCLFYPFNKAVAVRTGLQHVLESFHRRNHDQIVDLLWEDTKVPDLRFVPALQHFECRHRLSAIFDFTAVPQLESFTVTTWDEMDIDFERAKKWTHICLGKRHEKRFEGPFPLLLVHTDHLTVLSEQLTHVTFSGRRQIDDFRRATIPSVEHLEIGIAYAAPFYLYHLPRLQKVSWPAGYHGLFFIAEEQRHLISSMPTTVHFSVGKKK